MLSNKIIHFAALALIPLTIVAQEVPSTKYIYELFPPTAVPLNIGCSPECSEAVSMIISLETPDSDTVANLIDKVPVIITINDNTGMKLIEAIVRVPTNGFAEYDLRFLPAEEFNTVKIVHNTESLGKASLSASGRLLGIINMSFGPLPNSEDTDVKRIPANLHVDTTFFNSLTGATTSRVQGYGRGYGRGYGYGYGYPYYGY